MKISNGMNKEWQKLVESLKERGALKTPAVIDAFENIDRKDFVTDEYQDVAYVDTALPIGEGQTISQPYTVAFMLELLQPKAGDKVLDIGAGSGWQTALLAYIVGGKGKVCAIELIPRLCKKGESNVSKYDFLKEGRVEWICGDASTGLISEAPFDKIIAAAALGDKLPDAWKTQLKNGGRLVTPIKNSVWLFVKRDDGKLEEYEHPGFAFVPFK